MSRIKNGIELNQLLKILNQLSPLYLAEAWDNVSQNNFYRFIIFPLDNFYLLILTSLVLSNF